MGLFSTKSSSSNETNNFDNRSIVDNSGADQSQFTDNAIRGANANNTGTINITDGRAFDIIDSANDNATYLAESFGAQTVDVVSEVFGAGQSMFGDVANIVSEMGDNNLSTALAFNDTTQQQLARGNDLTLSLAQLSADSMLEQQDEVNDALVNSTKTAFQFAENFSRSDGNALAQTNMKTIGMVVGGAVAIALLMYMARK